MDTVTMPADIGARIEKLRTGMGKTRSEFGKLVGKTDSAVRAWESGRAQPTQPTLTTIARKTKTPLSKILGESFDAKAAQPNGAKPAVEPAPTAPSSDNAAASSQLEPEASPVAPEPPPVPTPSPAPSALQRAKERLMGWHRMERRRILGEASITAAAAMDAMGRGMDPKCDLIQDQERRFLALAEDYRALLSELDEDMGALR